MAGLPPSLEIILPTHNVEAWLAGHLDSLLDQSFSAWHAHIVLNGCTDRSEQIARDYASRDPRIEVHTSPVTGVGSARNFGFRLSRSRYVAFADPDDVVPTQAYEVLVGSLERTGSDLATGYAAQFGSTSVDRPYWTMQSGLFDHGRDATSIASEPRLILDHTTWNKVYRRDFLVRNNITFPEDTAIGEDAHHSVHAICRAEKIDVVTDTVYRHRQRPGSLTSVIRRDESVVQWLKVTRDIEALVRKTGLPEVAMAWSERMLSREAWTRARQVHHLRQQGTIDDLQEFLRSTILTAPRSLWSALPLLLRWGYCVLDVAPIENDPLGLAAEIAACTTEVADTIALPEFSRFSNEFAMSGTELRARLWRESLLLPALRLLECQSEIARHRSFARVVVFQRRFVAEHQLLPGEQELLALAADANFEEILSQRRQEHRSSISALASRVRPRSVDLTVRIATEPSSDEPVLPAALALAEGSTTGAARQLPWRTIAKDGQTTLLTTRIRHSDLSPAGRWSLGMIFGPQGHFTRVALTTSTSALMPKLFRPLVVLRGPAGHTLVETRPQLLRRVWSRATRRARSYFEVRTGSADLHQADRAASVDPTAAVVALVPRVTRVRRSTGGVRLTLRMATILESDLGSSTVHAAHLIDPRGDSVALQLDKPRSGVNVGVQIPRSMLVVGEFYGLRFDLLHSSGSVYSTPAILDYGVEMPHAPWATTVLLAPAGPDNSSMTLIRRRSVLKRLARRGLAWVRMIFFGLQATRS